MFFPSTFYLQKCEILIQNFYQQNFHSKWSFLLHFSGHSNQIFDSSGLSFAPTKLLLSFILSDGNPIEPEYLSHLKYGN